MRLSFPTVSAVVLALLCVSVSAINTLQPLWNQSIPGSAIPSFITVGRDMIVVSVPTSNEPFGQSIGVYSFSKTGAWLWGTTEAGPGPAFQISEFVVFDSINNTVYGLYNNGSVAYDVEVTQVSSLKPSPSADGSFYFIDAQSILAKGVAATGNYTIVFNSPMYGFVSDYCFSADGSVIAVGKSDENVHLLFKYKLHDGTKEWVAEVGTTIDFTRGGLACLSDGSSAFRDAEGAVHFYSASGVKTGVTSHDGLQAPLLAAGNSVLASSTSDKLQRWNVSGELVWSTELPFAVPDSLSADGQTVYGRTSSGIFGLSTATGDLEFLYTGVISSAPVTPLSKTELVLANWSPRDAENSFYVAVYSIVAV